MEISKPPRIANPSRREVILEDGEEFEDPRSSDNYQLPPRSMPTTPETACSGMKIKFIDCDPHFYTCRVKEAIHITPHSNNVKKDNGIEIPEAWKLTI